MDINKCPNCQKQFDQDKRLSKQLPCGCVSCLKCLNFLYKITKKIECVIHQQVYSINPEELQVYVVQQQVQLQELLEHQEYFIDQELITEQFGWLQDQYEQKKNQNREILKEIQDSSQFFQLIQSLAIKEIIKSLLDQFSINNERIKNLLKRLTELQAIHDIQQQQQYAQRVGQQNPRLRQNVQGQLQQQFQQILREINELKKDSLMDIQSLRINVQRCMFEMFVYLSENSQGQLLTDSKAEWLVQKYFKQFKVIRGLCKVSNSLVQQKSSFQNQNNQQQLSQENQNRDQQQQQTQIIDKQQNQDFIQIKQFSVSQENSLQEKQVNDARLFVQQIEQKLINISNEISFSKQECQICQEQAILLKYVSDPPDILTFEKLVKFLNKIKEENLSIQSLNNSPLNNSRLIEYPQILNQLSTVTDQQICLKLCEILNIAQNQSQIQQVAVNALTILNYMNQSFTNQDLSYLDLTKADLSDTTFTSCNFANSNLTQANLRNTKFIDCDFTSSNLTSIITEHPHIFTGHSYSLTSVSISSDSNIIVSGSYKSIIL